jgi:prenyltransferase beta subunit
MTKLCRTLLTMLLIAAWAAMSLTVSRSAEAANAADSRFQPNLERTVSYLQKVQNEDGGFGGELGAKSDPDFSAWVALALAATGINPRDQSTAPQHYAAGHSVYTYLTEHSGELSSTTDFERELLVVDAAGTSPYEFGGVNLVAKILQRQLPDGSFTHEAGSSESPGMNDTIFAILALSPIKEPVVQYAVQKAAEWVEEEQDCDHGWPSIAHRIVATCPEDGGELAEEPESEVDMTGAAIEALNAAGRHGAEAEQVQEKAFQYLKSAQDANGGFPEEPGNREPNVASTAWVVQAMWSASINPETWLTHSGLAAEEPLGYMASMQQEDGHIRWETSSDANRVWMTAYVTPAFAGDPLPIPAVPYVGLPLEPPDSAESGNGGESSQPRGGVISGGGGGGALLFSRPQPDSKGYTPGGARQLEDRHERETKHPRNPGPARKAPVPTATSASVHRPKKHDQASHKSTGGVALTGTGTGGGWQGSGRDVKGLLIGAPTGALEPGAPGLHGAGAGENRTSWPAIGIGVAIALLALAGSQLERRRPEVIL